MIMESVMSTIGKIIDQAKNRTVCVNIFSPRLFLSLIITL